MTNTLHIYTRVSSVAQQEEGTSLENQRQLGIRKAKELGVESRLWNEGGQSSFFDDLNNRPVLVSLLMLIETGVVKHLFVYNTDRLSRNQQTWAIIRFKLLKYGVTVHTSTGQMTLKNPVDDLMLGILSEISQYDNRIRSERSRMGKFQKIQQGNWKGGPPPFGYRLENKQLVIDAFESEWVRKMFDWYCLGISVKEIQSRLGANGVMTRRGNSQWSLGSIQVILRNTVYVGHFDYSDKMVGETVRITSPEIIDAQLFQTAQAKRTNPRCRQQQVNPTKHFYLLRHLLECGHCGSPMGGRINKAGHQNLYYCVKSERSWKSRGDDHIKRKRGCGCSMVRSINIGRTDQLVWGIVASVVEDLWHSLDEIDGARPVQTVSLDDCDQITTAGLTRNAATVCTTIDHSDQPCHVPAGTQPSTGQRTPPADLIQQFPATAEYVRAVLAPSPANTVTVHDQKAVITELVHKITVHFDVTANKHRIDVEVCQSIQAALLKHAAKSATAAESVQTVGGHVAADNGGERTGDCLLTSKKPGLGQSTPATEQNYSVTVE